MSEQKHIPIPHKKGAALPQGGPKRRKSPKVARAISVIATLGKSQREAAAIVGMNEDALSRALAQPHNRAALDEAKALACMESEALKPLARAIAIREGMDLMQNSPSHQVRARLVEFFAGEARQPLVNVNINQPEPATGYTYRRPDKSSATDSQSGADDAQVIEGEAETPDDHDNQ